MSCKVYVLAEKSIQKLIANIPQIKEVVNAQFWRNFLHERTHFHSNHCRCSTVFTIVGFVQRKGECNLRRALRLPTIVLIVCMLCNALTTVGVAALSETQAAQKGAEVFEAWNIINYTEYSYMVNDYVSPNHMFVENLRTEYGWDGLLTAWRIATFDGGSEVSQITKEASYYEAFLFNILYDESTKSLGTSFVSSLASSTGDIEKNWKAIGTSAWNRLCEVDNKFKNNPDLEAVFTENSILGD